MLRAIDALELSGTEPVTVLRDVEAMAAAVWRAGWERWGELAVEGGTQDPVEVYRRCQEELRRIVG